MCFRVMCAVTAALSSAVWGFAGDAKGYDPLWREAAFEAAVLRLTVNDAGRTREIPVKVYLPAATNAAPVVLFSHGLGGSRENNVYLGQHWAARGYVAVFMQHPGSDESVWKDVPPSERMKAMRAAASTRNCMLRVKDVPAVLDQLEAWGREAGHALAGRLDMGRVGMSGHSFGAVTTQAVSGQRFPLGVMDCREARIKAAVAFSPSAPRWGSAARAFGAVVIPWLLMTGTKDTSIVNDTDVAARLAVFPALPPGGKYELVLAGAEHSAFGDRALPGDRETRNPNHHRAILALTTAFWDTYLRGDAAAKTWLDGEEGIRAVLAPDDRWQKK